MSEIHIFFPVTNLFISFKKQNFRSLAAFENLLSQTVIGENNSSLRAVYDSVRSTLEHWSKITKPHSQIYVILYVKQMQKFPSHFRFTAFPI